MKALFATAMMVVSLGAAAYSEELRGKKAEEILAEGEVLSAQGDGQSQYFVVRDDDKIYGCKVKFNENGGFGVFITCRRAD
jgi:hypothetical protein